MELKRERVTAGGNLPQDFLLRLFLLVRLVRIREQT